MNLPVDHNLFYASSRFNFLRQGDISLRMNTILVNISFANWQQQWHLIGRGLC